MSTQLSAKGQKTRSEILEAAFALFLERGIHATSVDDILDAAHKGKSQFYHYFKNKEDLIHRLLQTHLVELKEGNMPYDIEITNWDDFESWIYKVVEFYRSLGKARGCILGMIGQEPLNKNLSAKIFRCFSRQKCARHVNSLLPLKHRAH